jgi:excisionase family DNA binding protein
MSPQLSPPARSITPRLLTLKAAAQYLGVSYWTARDLILNGTLRPVRMPAARIDAGRRRGKHGELPPARLLVEPTHPGVAGRHVRRVLVDRQDLDRLIEAWKESA